MGQTYRTLMSLSLFPPAPKQAPNEHGVFTDAQEHWVMKTKQVSVKARFAKSKAGFHWGLDINAPTHGMCHGPSVHQAVKTQAKAELLALKEAQSYLNQYNITNKDIDSFVRTLTSLA